MKNRLKILLLLGTALALLWGGMHYKTKYQITDIDSSVSPDGERTLLFQSVGEPDFPFGSSHARLALKEGSRTTAKYRFDVANDGKTLWPENWSTEWQENCVRAVISGEEQPDAVYVLFFDGTVRTENSELRGQGSGGGT